MNKSNITVETNINIIKYALAHSTTEVRMTAKLN